MLAGARDTNQAQTEYIALDSIDPSPFKLRHHANAAMVETLAASICDVGLIHPVVVRPKSDGRYEIVAGTLRLAAARRLGCSRVRALVLQLDDIEARRVRLTENSARFDLTPMDEARFIHDLLHTHEKAQVAKIVHRSVRSVEMARARLALPELIRAGITEAGLSGRHATALLRLQAWPGVQSAAFSHAITHRTPVVACERAVRRILASLRTSDVKEPEGLLARLGVESFEQLFDGTRPPPTGPLVEAHANTLARDLRRLRADRARLDPLSNLGRRLSEIRTLIASLCQGDDPLYNRQPEDSRETGFAIVGPNALEAKPTSLEVETIECSIQLAPLVRATPDA
jgi:ParB/RepB/Spo0J family partition protein